KFTQSSSQSGSFIDARRHDHYRAFVEDHLQLETEVTDEFNRFGFVRTPRGDDDAAGGHAFRSATNQFADKAIGRRFCELSLFPSRGPVKQRAILRNNAVEQIKPRTDFHKVVEFPTGNKNRFAPGLLHGDKRRNGAFCEVTIPGYSAVVVAC